MREQLLAQMEAVRANPALAQPSADFQYTAIEVRDGLICIVRRS